jgi:dTDP-4-amino-4,6-dideoxygalactose transaminase
VDAGTALTEFEHAFRSKLGLSDNALLVATGSGRTALSLILRVLKAKYPDKKKVLLPRYGCKGTFDPIVSNGLIPVYVDIDHNLLPSSAHIKRCLADDVLACLLVHLTGKQMDTTDVIRAARACGVATIEDHCQNVGGEVRVACKGDIKADFYFYSFGIGKNVMATAGGALVANILHDEIEAESKNLEQEDIHLARERFSYFYDKFFGSKRWKSLRRRSEIPRWIIQNPFNYVAMNPLDALLLVQQIGKLDEIIEKRQRHAAKIITILAKFSDLFQFQDPTDHIYTKLSIIIKDKEILARFRSFMFENGIELENMYTPLHLRDFGRRFYRDSLEVTEQVYPLVVNIPVRPNLTENEVDRIAGLIERFGRLYAQGH